MFGLIDLLFRSNIWRLTPVCRVLEIDDEIANLETFAVFLNKCSPFFLDDRFDGKDDMIQYSGTQDLWILESIGWRETRGGYEESAGSSGVKVNKQAGVRVMPLRERHRMRRLPPLQRLKTMPKSVRRTDSVALLSASARTGCCPIVVAPV